MSGPWKQPKSQTPLEEQRTVDSLGTPCARRVPLLVACHVMHIHTVSTGHATGGLESQGGAWPRARTHVLSARQSITCVSWIGQLGKGEALGAQRMPLIKMILEVH